MKIWTIALLLGFSFYGYSQTISKNDYTAFFNDILSEEDSSGPIIIYYKSDVTYVEEYLPWLLKDTSFTEADTMFMSNQLQKIKGYKWRKGIITNSKIVHDPYLNKDKHLLGGCYMYSVPVFSIDKNSCLFYESNLCGPLCGSGSVNLYRKQNGRWKYIQFLSMWVS